MATTIRLTVLTGAPKNRQACLCGPTKWEVGRAADFFGPLAGTEWDRLISRHHCRLEIDPPLVRVTDLCSSNGTYVNGKRIEPISTQPGHPSRSENVVDVKNGDLITVDGATFQVDVVDCPHLDEVWE